MQKGGFILLLTCFLFSILCSFSFETSNEVLVLTEENFNEELQLHEAMLVQFYAPWCPHSQALAPEWVKAAEQLASSPVRIAKVDGTENEDLAREYEIGAYPMIKYFRGGRISEYKGGRTAPEIVNWILRKYQSKSILLQTEEEFDKFQETHELYSLGIFNNLESEAARGYQILADEEEAGLVHALTTSTHLRDKLFYPRKLHNQEFIIVFKPFDNMRSDLPLTTTSTAAAAGNFDFDKVSDFIKYESTPPVQEFSTATMRRISQSPIKQHALFFTDKTAAHHTQAMEIYTLISTSYRNKLLFVNVPSTEIKVLQYFSITPESLPAMVIVDFSDKSSGMKPFPYQGALEHTAIAAFITSVLDGKAQPASTPSGVSGTAGARSEEVTPEDTAGDVVVLKSKSFAELVLDNDKDVLVEFYAPWCGHCKNLAPIWEELGRQMQGRTDLVVAKLDYTANEVEVTGASITGFPTILLFKHGQKEKPIVYTGQRELLPFISFIDTHTRENNRIQRQEL